MCVETTILYIPNTIIHREINDKLLIKNKDKKTSMKYHYDM